MKQYLVTAISVNLNTGTLELTEKQYQARSHLVKKLNGNRYEIVKPVQFKRGEVFGYDGEMSKAMISEMVPCEQKQKEEKKTKEEKKQS